MHVAQLKCLDPFAHKRCECVFQFDSVARAHDRQAGRPPKPSGVIYGPSAIPAVALNRWPHRDAADPDGAFGDDPAGLLSAPPLDSELHGLPCLLVKRSSCSVLMRA